jgi:hypothetical protein
MVYSDGKVLSPLGETISLSGAITQKSHKMISLYGEIVSQPG